MFRFVVLTVAVLALAGTGTATGRDDAEVKLLKERIATLEAKLEAANLKIENLKQENAKLKAGGGKGAAKAAAGDAFAKEAVLTGRRVMGKDIEQHLTLSITKREGTAFEGELTIDHKPTMQVLTVKVTGTASVGNGNVKFTTEKAGKFQQMFDGRFANGECSFKCSGTSRVGDPVEGKGYLSAK